MSGDAHVAVTHHDSVEDAFRYATRSFSESSDWTVEEMAGKFRWAEVGR